MKNLLFLLLFLSAFAQAQDEVTYYNSGAEAHNKGDYTTAIDLYKKCLALNPKNADAQTNIAIAYYNQSIEAYNKKDYAKCIEHCTNSLKYNAKNGEAYCMIGNGYKEQKKHQDAILNYGKAIELNNKNALFYAARAWVYNDIHDHKNRLIDIKKAAELNPKNAEYQFHCGKFKQEASQEEFKTALDNYNNAIKLNPKYTEAYMERGAYYMTFQQFDKALPDLKKAKELGADVAHLIEAAEFELNEQKK